jgi:hypothetical protein
LTEEETKLTEEGKEKRGYEEERKILLEGRKDRKEITEKKMEEKT